MLKITKKGDKYWLFEDSEIGLFSPSKFTINLLNNDITIVYENGLKSKTYNVIDCEIYDLGSLVPFTTSSGNEFMAKLEEFNCPCFQKNENVYNNTIYPTESRTISNRWSLTNSNEYYRSRADYSGFNAETLNTSTAISTINQTVASLSGAFYRTSMSKKISKIYVDGSNVASGITSLKLGVFAFQRATVTDPNLSAVNLINLGEFTITKNSGEACKSWELTPTNIEIPTNYLVSCVLMKTGGTGSEANIGIDFKIEDY